MKRKLFLTFLFVAIISCALAVSAFAASLSDFINVDLTLTDGTMLTKTDKYAQTLLGFPDGVSNVKRFYYPQGSSIIADSSFSIAEKDGTLNIFMFPKA